MLAPSHAYHPGRSDAPLFLLCCAGRHEEAATRPAAGPTGDTMQAALEILHRLAPEHFPYQNLLDNGILNSVEDIHYAALTGRTEPRAAEIKVPANLERLRRACQGRGLLVILGSKPLLAARAAGLPQPWLVCTHPSLQAMNRQYRLEAAAEAWTSTQRAQGRLRLWCDRLLRSAT